MTDYSLSKRPNMAKNRPSHSPRLVKGPSPIKDLSMRPISSAKVPLRAKVLDQYLAVIHKEKAKLKMRS